MKQNKNDIGYYQDNSTLIVIRWQTAKKATAIYRTSNSYSKSHFFVLSSACQMPISASL